MKNINLVELINKDNTINRTFKAMLNDAKTLIFITNGDKSIVCTTNNMKIQMLDIKKEEILKRKSFSIDSENINGSILNIMVQEIMDGNFSSISNKKKSIYNSYIPVSDFSYSILCNNIKKEIFKNHFRSLSANFEREIDRENKKITFNIRTLRRKQAGVEMSAETKIVFNLEAFSNSKISFIESIYTPSSKFFDKVNLMLSDNNGKTIRDFVESYKNIWERTKH